MRGKKNSQDATSAPTAKGGSDSSYTNTEMVQASHFLQSGWRVAVALLLPALSGIWIDSNFETKPIFTIVGVLVGMVVVWITVTKLVDPTYNGDKND